MTDRRQGDRRETSILKKKIAISLSSFIYICIIFIVTIAAVIASKISYNQGYEEGYMEGYSVSYNDYLENMDYNYEE